MELCNLELNFDVLSSIPDDLILSLGSEDEVRQYLFQKMDTLVLKAKVVGLLPLLVMRHPP